MEWAVIIEIVCFVVALFCLTRDTDLVWRSFTLFMLITCLTEITGAFIREAGHPNGWLYNIFLVFEASFTSLMFSHLLSKYIKSKPLILSGLALILLLYVFDIAKHGFLVYNDLTGTVMSVIFVIYSFYYYFLLIRDEHYVDLKHSAPFWWVAGALFFYFGSTAVNLFYTPLKHVNISGHNITYFIFGALCFILYGCWSYSFICRKWATTT